MADLSPHSSLIHALANQSLPWWKALAELVDNSVDAGSTRIEIIAKNKVLTVKDNGAGIKNILAVATLGFHAPSETTRLGRYGVGLKDCWLFASNVLNVRTIHDGQLATLRVDTTELVRNNWKCDDPKFEPSNEPSGTVITLPLREGRNLPGIDAFDELSFVFTPAIQNGLQIVRNNGMATALRPHVMPSLSDVVKETFDVDGKAVTIEIGMLPEGVSLNRGPFWMQYEHRIIDKTSIGAGGYSTLRVAGKIILGEGWELSKNKDDLSTHKDLLSDAILERIEPLLQKATSLSETIESAALRTSLEEDLNEVVRHIAKSRYRMTRPGKGGKSGTITPKNTERRVRVASATNGEPGDVDCPSMAALARSAFKLDWCELDNGKIGWFDYSGMRVFLNLGHPFINEAKKSQNRLALLCCAAPMIADDACRHDAKRAALFTFSYSDFSTALGGLMSRIKEARINEPVAI
jgi:hypothetical protein